MAKITVGILGLGTVGTGVIKLLAGDSRFKIKWVAVRDKSKPRDIDLSSIRLTDEPLDVVNDPEVEIVVEVLEVAGFDGCRCTVNTIATAVATAASAIAARAGRHDDIRLTPLSGTTACTSATNL